MSLNITIKPYLQCLINIIKHTYFLFSLLHTRESTFVTLYFLILDFMQQILGKEQLVVTIVADQHHCSTC